MDVVQSCLNPRGSFIKGLKDDQSSALITAPEACLQVPQSFQLGIVRLPVQTGQHGSKLTVRQHKLTLRVMTVNENGDGLESDRLGHGYALAGA